MGIYSSAFQTMINTWSALKCFEHLSLIRNGFQAACSILESCEIFCNIPNHSGRVPIIMQNLKSTSKKSTFPEALGKVWRNIRKHDKHRKLQCFLPVANNWETNVCIVVHKCLSVSTSVYQNL